MTHQAHPLEGVRPCQAPYRTFFQRFGYLGTCALPAEVLDDTALIDSDTGLAQPSLRQLCSQDGLLCYAHVLCSFSEGLYLANVAATPDLAGAERVVLAETDLIYALAWDERLSWRTPAQIRHLMQAQAQELAPLRPSLSPEPAAAPFPTPVVPLSVVTTVEVTADELREAFDKQESHHASDAPNHPDMKEPVVCAVQQGLLRALSHALQELLESATDRYSARVLQALSALVRRVQRWQRQTRQRVVNAVYAWDARWNRPAWALTLGVPAALLDVAQ